MRAFLLLSAFSLDLSAEVVGLDLFLLPPPAILYFYFCFGLNHFTASQLVWFYVQNCILYVENWFFYVENCFTNKGDYDLTLVRL